MQYFIEKSDYNKPESIVEDTTKELVLNHLDGSRELCEKFFFIPNLRNYY
jgi:hypothetical protein